MWLAIGALSAAAAVLEVAWRLLGAPTCLGAIPEDWVIRSLVMGLGCAAGGLGLPALVAASARVVVFRHLEGEVPVDFGRHLRRCVAFAVTGLLAAGLGCSLRLRGWEASAESLAGSSASEWSFLVHGDPRVSPHGATMSADVLASGGETLAVVTLSAKEPVDDGSLVEVVGRFEPLGRDAWSRGRFMAGEVARVRVMRVARHRTPAGAGAIMAVRRAVLARLSPDESEPDALLAGMVCGRTTELAQTGADTSFSRCGLTHLVSVSGGHLALIMALLERVRDASGWGGAWWRGGMLAVMAGYVVFTGGSASAIRSVVMMAGSFAALFGGRRPHPLSALALTVFALCCIRPGVVFDLGFQLSAMSVLFILLFARYVSHALQVMRVPSSLAEPLALTLVAQWATLPLTVPVFAEVSLVSPVANIAVGPVMNLALLAGFVSAPVSLALQGDWVFALPRALASLSIFMARLFEQVPFAAIAIDAPAALGVIAYGAATLLFWRWPNPNGRVLCAGVCGMALIGCLWAVRWSRFAPPAITVMDVGQGDAILIRDGPAAVLVDAGVDEATARALMRNHAYHLDAVLVTHWDRDHWGGLPRILDMIDVDALLVADGAGDAMPRELEGTAPSPSELRCGDRVRVGRFSLEVLWPRGSVSGEENADSLCLLATFEETGESLSVLLTGDAERLEVVQFAKSAGDVDVLKVGHHGSRESVDSRILSILDPEICVASAGEGNPYGHPDRACVEAVEGYGATFLCTVEEGDISIRPSG